MRRCFFVHHDIWQFVFILMFGNALLSQVWNQTLTQTLIACCEVLISTRTWITKFWGHHTKVTVGQSIALGSQLLQNRGAGARRGDNGLMQACARISTPIEPFYNVDNLACTTAKHCCKPLASTCAQLTSAYKYMFWTTGVSYCKVPNKRAQRVDNHPGHLRGSRGAFWVFLSQFCSILTNFCLFLVKYSIPKWWGRVYLSRCVYSALYGMYPLNEHNSIQWRIFHW